VHIGLQYNVNVERVLFGKNYNYRVYRNKMQADTADFAPVHN